MRSIFQVCFNTYRDDKETSLNDMTAIKYLKFSPRLFEIKYSQRMEPVGFIQESNMFVVTEGEAARCLNFNSGSFFTYRNISFRKIFLKKNLKFTPHILFNLKWIIF